jgi:hypothetical protein
MRTLIVSAVLVFLGSLVGCGHTHSHGICDCEFEDYCTSRSPWVRGGVMVAPAGGAPVVVEKVAPPSKLPDVKKKDL